MFYVFIILKPHLKGSISNYIIVGITAYYCYYQSFYYQSLQSSLTHVDYVKYSNCLDNNIIKYTLYKPMSCIKQITGFQSVMCQGPYIRQFKQQLCHPSFFYCKCLNIVQIRMKICTRNRTTIMGQRAVLIYEVGYTKM